jgi:hypothetical protein
VGVLEQHNWSYHRRFSIDFQQLSQPLIYADLYQYPNASTQSDLLAYPTALNISNGSRSWNGSFELTYTFVPNNYDTLAGVPDFGRTLVMRTIQVTQESSAQEVGVALTRWYSSGIGQRVSTVEAVPFNYTIPGYVAEKTTGYVMTVPPTSGSTILVECISSANYPNATNPDHLTTATACDAKYNFLRTAGYLYSSPQGTAVPIYRCKPGTGTGGTTNSHFVSLQSNCENEGTVENPIPLGYALPN